MKTKSTVTRGLTVYRTEDGTVHRDDDKPAIILNDFQHKPQKLNIYGVNITSSWGPPVIGVKVKTVHSPEGVDISQVITPFSSGISIWCKNGYIHRDRGPAILQYDQRSEKLISESYWHMGRLHRTDGPAISHHRTHHSEYWVNGKRHNPFGPAIAGDNIDEYYLNGKHYNRDDYWNRRNAIRLAEMILRT